MKYGLRKSALVYFAALIGFGHAAHSQQNPPPAAGAGKKPNILVIWGDDIGITNISHHNKGLMGYRTPNIDRIANEGISFTD